MALCRLVDSYQFLPMDPMLVNVPEEPLEQLDLREPPLSERQS